MRKVDSLTMSHLEGLAAEGVVWVELAYGTKHTRRGWDYFITQQQRHKGPSIDLATNTLNRGGQLGYLVHGDVWVLDLDTEAGTRNMPMWERFEDLCSNLYMEPPMVQTPSGGIHAIFRLPQDLRQQPLKNHVCHPIEDEEKQEWDFKFGPRTLVVAAGSRNESGTYQPITEWRDPPILDPRLLSPQMEILKDQSPFLIDLRPEKARVIAAQRFLRNLAPVATGGNARNLALQTVCEMLVGYYGLEPEYAFYLMTHEAEDKLPWVARCFGGDETSRIRASKQIWAALNNALECVPSYGAWKFREAVQQGVFIWCIPDFLDVLRLLPGNHHCGEMTSMQLFRSLQRLFGIEVPDGMVTIFGEVLLDAIYDGSIPLTKRDLKGTRYYCGVSDPALAIAKQRFDTRSATKP